MLVGGDSLITLAGKKSEGKHDRVETGRGIALAGVYPAGQLVRGPFRLALVCLIGGINADCADYQHKQNGYDIIHGVSSTQ